MKESYWGYFLILLGIFVIVIMMLVNNVTTTSTQDYYLLKEVTEAAMKDAVDWGTYRDTGELRIIKEKFIENFLRRISESVNINSTYTFEFYDLYESPPKVSIKVTTSTGQFRIGGEASSFDIVNKIDGILEDGLYSDSVVIRTNIDNGESQTQRTQDYSEDTVDRPDTDDTKKIEVNY